MLVSELVLSCKKEWKLSNIVNETARKAHAKRLGLHESTSWAEINEHLARQQASNTLHTNAVIQTTKAAWSGELSLAGA